MLRVGSETGSISSRGCCQAGQEGGNEAVGVGVDPGGVGGLGGGEDANLGCVDERQRGGSSARCSTCTSSTVATSQMRARLAERYALDS